MSILVHKEFENSREHETQGEKRCHPLIWENISRQYVKISWEDGIYCSLFDAERKPDTKNEWKHII